MIEKLRLITVREISFIFLCEMKLQNRWFLTTCLKWSNIKVNF
jgi:hypothetical protein